MTEKGMITAKVAQILNATDLALNKGEEDGVEVGMKFAVLDPVGRDIKDPDTGEVLDSINIAKTVLKVVQVSARLAVARTFRSKSTGFLGSFEALTTHRSETLRSDERRLQQQLSAKESYVKIGDAAVQYVGDFPGVVLDF